MNQDLIRAHRRDNIAQAIVLIFGMGAIFAVVGWMFLGRAGLYLATVVAAISAIAGPTVSPGLVLRMYHARRIAPEQAPELTRIFHDLCRRAGFESIPGLYYVPTRMLNAFAVGSGQQAAVAVTDGMLRVMNQRELAGVLAHELSHIRFRDTRIMALGDVFSRMTATISQLASIMLLISLPLLLLGGVSLAASAKLFLLSMAHIPSVLLQLALSRSREFNADLGAAELTGDPVGLATALQKLERAQLGPWWQRVLMPGRSLPEPATLRTHPVTEERIERLMSLVPQSPQPVESVTRSHTRHLIPAEYPKIRVGPRWHVSGLWY